MNFLVIYTKYFVNYFAQFKTKPYVIGLTGGIASGKSSIAKRLKDLGAHTISCDQLGHLAYKKGTECFRQMVEYFGDGILNEENEIDRKKLGPLVFSNKVGLKQGKRICLQLILSLLYLQDHLERLNLMVWPEIRRLYTKEINELKQQNFQGVVVLDAAILLEAGWQEDCAEVWVAIVPKDEAINRIVERDHLTTEQAARRVESQLSNSDRVTSANVVICSSWEPEVTAAQVLKAWKFVQEFLEN
jgi:phosphopantetheine adenylyltransferase/dephospho-CoA kinase